jgi:hypothetical protein
MAMCIPPYAPNWESIKPEIRPTMLSLYSHFLYGKQERFLVLLLQKKILSEKMKDSFLFPKDKVPYFWGILNLFPSSFHQD